MQCSNWHDFLRFSLLIVQHVHVVHVVHHEWPGYVLILSKIMVEVQGRAKKTVDHIIISLPGRTRMFHAFAI